MSNKFKVVLGTIGTLLVLSVLLFLFSSASNDLSDIMLSLKTDDSFFGPVIYGLYKMFYNLGELAAALGFGILLGLIVYAVIKHRG